jgi:hypothetical protein
MKTNRLTRLITTAFILAAFPTAGCAEKEKEKEKTAEAPLPPAKPVTATPAVPVVDPSIPDVTSAKWRTIKDLSYDQRVLFFDGLKQLETRVDEQISELTARRAAMPGTANTKDWDFAMKEMVNARSYLKGMGEELSKATPETWAQQKDKVGLAWVRTQEAYDKVKSSTTT